MKQKFMKHLLFLACIALFAISCQRRGEPVARICTEANISSGENVTVHLNDTLVLVNCSERYTKQRWLIPGGGTSNDETAYFVPTTVGFFNVYLYVSDEDFVNEYEAVKIVEVLP